MNENKEPNQFFRNEKLDENQIFVEVPTDQQSQKIRLTRHTLTAINVKDSQ